MRKLRGLVIGAGYFSQFHFDAWSRIDDIEIVGVCDVDGDKAGQAAEKWNIAHVFSDASAALERLKPDFVDIVTRPETHCELIRLSANIQTAIICQKPLAPTYPEAQRIVELVRRKGGQLMVHDNFRFQPWYREIKRQINNGLLGDRLHNLYFRCRPGDGWGADAYLSRQPYFREMARLLVFETGVHFIDTFRYMAGEVEQVYAILRRLNEVIRGEDTGLITFRFASGAVGVWDANRYNESTAEDVRYTFGQFLIEGNGGSMRLAEDGRLFVKRLGQAEYEHNYQPSRRGFSGDCVWTTQRHFIDCLRTGSQFETSGEEYLRTLEIQEAVYESQQRSQAVTIRSGSRRIVDLSLSIDNSMRGVSITQYKSIPVDGFNATTLSLYSHSGTHMDAPKHFVEGAAGIDQQLLDVCCGPALVIDLTPIEPRELITVERLGRWHDKILAGTRILLRTDWYKRHGTPSYRDELPRISLELARWMVQRRVALVGVEPPSVADVNDMRELTDVHQTLFLGGVVIVEGLAHLDGLVRDQVEFIALPLKIAQGDGCPVRAVAIEQ